MQRKLLSSGIALALGVCLGAARANAAVTVVTWSGLVEAGTDTGIFLNSGGDLAGRRFTYRIVVDDTVPTPLSFTFPGTLSDIYGGSIYGLPSPASAVLTIGGVRGPVMGVYFGQQFNAVNFGNSFNNGIFHETQSRTMTVDPVNGYVSDVALYVVDTTNLLGISWDYH